MEKIRNLHRNPTHPKMSIGWSSLPLLPLRCVLEHLSTEDALAAMTVCRHWRSAILLYEGHKDTLTLRAKQMERSVFLSRVFRKHTRRLHVHLDCAEEELDKFINYVLPKFFDTIKLQEILFIGPYYTRLQQDLKVVKLKRIITESLVYKHLHSLQTLALMGCEMDTPKNDNDRYTNKHLEYYSRPLSFNIAPSPADGVLSSCNTSVMMFSALQHILVDYDQISSETLLTLSHLNALRHLSVNIRRPVQTRHDWRPVAATSVHINVIGSGRSTRRIEQVMENVLVEELPLTSLKIMYCETIVSSVIMHVVRLYRETLRELVWADCPLDKGESSRHADVTYEPCHENPFILLCWQCVNLRRLVIHGYWVWQYDIVGFVRLRKSLEQLEVSAIYQQQERFRTLRACPLVRVLAADTVRAPHAATVQQVNSFTDFSWAPAPLPRGLRARAAPRLRAAYVLQEALGDLQRSYSD